MKLDVRRRKPNLPWGPPLHGNGVFVILEGVDHGDGREDAVALVPDGNVLRILHDPSFSEPL